MSQTCCHRIRQPPAGTLGGTMKKSTRIHRNQHEHQRRRDQESDGSNKLRLDGPRKTRSSSRNGNRRNRRRRRSSSTRDSTRSKRFPKLTKAAEPPPTPKIDINNNNNDNDNSNSNSNSRKCPPENNHHQPPAHNRLPSDLLDRLAGEILEHTKELGLFDEMRMKLLEGIECSKEFSKIKQNFKDELEGFCSRADLGLPRSKLREKLNTRTLNRSARQLRDHVNQVSREHWNELRKLYDHQANQFLKDLLVVASAAAAPKSHHHHHHCPRQPERLEADAVSSGLLSDSNSVNNNNNNGNRTVIEFT